MLILILLAAVCGGTSSVGRTNGPPAVPPSLGLAGETEFGNVVSFCQSNLECSIGMCRP